MRFESFGRLSDGRLAGLYILENSNGMRAAVTNYGAALVCLVVPDRDGEPRDVVLGYDDAAGYEAGTESFGGTVGRYANRVKDAAIYLNGKRYELTANDGPNALHGGRDFYVHRLWDVMIPFGADSITFVLSSPDGDQGFPGGLRIEVRYTLTGDNELHLDYRAALTGGRKPGIDADAEAALTCGRIPCTDVDPEAALTCGRKPDTDADAEAAPLGGRTPCTDAAPEAAPLETALNLTNHSYFNLNGHDSGSVLDQIVWIDADSITETDANSLPTGRFIEVEGTPMDFRTPKPLGRDIESDYEPLHIGSGYDHNYILKAVRTGIPLEDSIQGGSQKCPEGTAKSTESPADTNKLTEWPEDAIKLLDGQTGYRPVASMYSPASGIRMSVLTDLPGMQLYTANYLGGAAGKSGAVYGRRSAACFETQFWPDAVNKENFPGSILREGETFASRTTYRFDIADTTEDQ